jgi:hypothetical protein
MCGCFEQLCVSVLVICVLVFTVRLCLIRASLLITLQFRLVHLIVDNFFFLFPNATTCSPELRGLPSGGGVV